MYCRYCGKIIDDDSIFCMYCGKRVRNIGADALVSSNVAGTTFHQEPIDEDIPIGVAGEYDDAEGMFRLGLRYYYGEGVEKDIEEAIKWYKKAAEQGHAEAQYCIGLHYDGHDGGAVISYSATEWFKKAAEQGHVKAQNYLGVLNKTGCAYLWELASDGAVEAVKWFKKAAEQGHAEAQYNLGECYEKGQGVEQSYDEAIKWYRMAAEQGNTKAQYELGRCYECGEIVKQDWYEAIKWYKKAAEQGNAYSQFVLGNYYYEGQCVERDYDEAYKWWKRAAQQGVAEAQCNVADSYYNGESVVQNYWEAVKWYKKAAEKNDKWAQYSLGLCYENGEGVIQSYDEAIKWYTKAAEQGIAAAQWSLGYFYYNGKGVEKNYKEAVKWYRKAATQWHIWAQNNLGLCYESGEGVEQNKAEAVKWYRKAAEYGNATAQYNLANCYYHGDIIEQNYEEAFKWYKKAAEKGYVKAQLNLGKCYYNGEGVTQNYNEALKWYKKAAQQSDSHAKKMVEELKDKNNQDKSAGLVKMDSCKGRKDKYGVVYSEDGKRLLRYKKSIWNIFKKTPYQYVVKEGTEVICDEAFSNCKDLVSVTIPQTVVEIGKNAFRSCSELTEVNFNAIACATKGKIFNGCYKLSKINFGEKITNIPSYLFSGCDGLRDLKIPNTVTTIGDDAFYHCRGLKGELKIPDSVTYIGSYAFSGCSGLTGELKIPDSVTTIGRYAFQYCSGLTGELKIPDSVTYIGSYAFKDCTHFHDLVIPEHVTVIGNYAFSGLRGLKEVYIHKNVTSIGYGAFANCSSLTKINVAEDNPVYCSKDGVLFSKDMTTLVQFPCDFDVKKTIIESQNSLHTKGIAPKRRIIIVPYIKHVPITYSISQGVTLIEISAFEGCRSFGKLIIPNSVTTIGSSAFAKSSIGIFILPKSICFIGEHAFESCLSLERIRIPNNISTIESYMFNLCSHLWEVVLGRRVYSIGKYAFSHSRLGRVVSLSTKPPYCDDDIFEEKTGLSGFDLNGLHLSSKCINEESLRNLNKEIEQLQPTRTLLVSKESKNAYDQAKIRYKFDNVEEIIPKWGKGRNFLFFDTETTGLPKDDTAPSSNVDNWPRLVQISWIVADEFGDILSKENHIISPNGFTIPQSASRLHKITTECAIAYGENISEVLNNFIEDLNLCDCIVGHNVDFDKKVVGAELIRLGRIDVLQQKKSFCTMKESVEYDETESVMPKPKFMKLQELHYKLFNCKFDNEHNAMADVEATFKCFWELKKQNLISMD